MIGGVLSTIAALLAIAAFVSPELSDVTTLAVALATTMVSVTQVDLSYREFVSRNPAPSGSTDVQDDCNFPVRDVLPTAFSDEFVMWKGKRVSITAYFLGGVRWHPVVLEKRYDSLHCPQVPDGCPVCYKTELPWPTVATQARHENGALLLD